MRLTLVVTLTNISPLLEGDAEISIDNFKIDFKRLNGDDILSSVLRRSVDQAIVGSIPGRSVISVSRSTQPSIHPGWVNRVPALLAGVKAGCARLC